MPRLKHASGSIVNVDDETAATLTGREWTPLEQVVTVPDGEPAAAWTVPQLKAYAAANGVDLGDATKKDDVLAVLTAPKS